MKIFNSTFPVSLPLIASAFLGSFALSACAATKPGALLIQSVDGNVGSISSVRTYEHDGRLYVAGSARATLTSGGYHVDIQLVGADGRVITEYKESLKLGHPRGARGRHGNASFVTSFPLSAAHAASSVRVTFHSSGH